MRRFHVKNGMKKALAFSLAAAMVLPGMAVTDKMSASAEASVPEPAKLFTLDKGFAAEGLKQAKFGQTIGWIEDVYPEGHQWAGLKYFSPINGLLTGQFQEVDTVIVQGSWVAKEEVGHKGYQQKKIPEGAKKQYLPDISTKDGTFLQLNPGWNQPTTAYDAEKGMVFWLEDTLVNESYPTYATEVDWENGTWKTDMDVIIRDTEGEYMEFDINNSAAEFENPFVGKNASGLTFSSWIKNTTPYREPVVYGKLGDLDGNGNIETDDALIILKHAVKSSILPDNAVPYADVNGDSSVDTDDALETLKVAIGLLDKFTGNEPEPDGGEAAEAEPLEDSEFFHVERRVIGKTKNPVTNKEEDDERNIVERQYLYFSGNGVTYVGDFKDPENVCTWTLDEALKSDETVNILNAKNGGKWNYVSYSFDGTDFHMYVNGKEATLVKNAGSAYKSDIMSFVAGKEAKTYLGGRGGGMNGNFNTHAIKTSADYYMDDIAIYASALSSEQAAKAYSDAAAAVEAEKNKETKLLKTYSFEGTSLSANELVAISGANADYQPAMNVDGRTGKGLQVKKTYQQDFGGAQLKENPFAGRDELTGVTVSYWMKSVANKRGVVTDGVLFSFIDDEHECTHEKVDSEAYLGANAMAKSQLYLNQAFIGSFSEGATKPVGANSLKNIYNYAPYTYGDPTTLEQWKQQFEIYDKTNQVSYYDDWKKLRNSLAEDWNFITVTINNAGFTMYRNGKLVENKSMNFKGERFCDYYWGRATEITRKGTNNAGARSLMDFITAEDTKAYLGYGYEQSSSTNRLTASDCYIDEISFYDNDMTAAEVQALYDSVK